MSTMLEEQPIVVGSYEFLYHNKSEGNTLTLQIDRRNLSLGYELPREFRNTKAILRHDLDYQTTDLDLIVSPIESFQCGVTLSTERRAEPVFLEKYYPKWMKSLIFRQTDNSFEEGSTGSQLYLGNIDLFQNEKYAFDAVFNCTTNMENPDMGVSSTLLLVKKYLMFEYKEIPVLTHGPYMYMAHQSKSHISQKPKASINFGWEFNLLFIFSMKFDISVLPKPKWEIKIENPLQALFEWLYTKMQKPKVEEIAE